MAHETYIGVNNIAQNVNKIWIGDNGVSKKVKRGYIGDANGIARLFFFSGYVWNRYNTITTYKWNKKDWLGYYPRHMSDPDYMSNITYGDEEVYYTDVYFTDTESQTSWKGTRHNFETWTVSWFRSNVQGNYVRGSWSRLVYVGAVTGWNGDSNRPRIYIDGYQAVANENRKYYEDLGTVTSTDINAYPSNIENVHTDGYYYQRAGETYSQGSYIDQVESENPSAYPDNGRGSDGYWYVKVES